MKKIFILTSIQLFLFSSICEAKKFDIEKSKRETLAKIKNELSVGKRNSFMQKEINRVVENRVNGRFDRACKSSAFPKYLHKNTVAQNAIAKIALIRARRRSYFNVANGASATEATDKFEKIDKQVYGRGGSFSSKALIRLGKNEIVRASDYFFGVKTKVDINEIRANRRRLDESQKKIKARVLALGSIYNIRNGLDRERDAETPFYAFNCFDYPAQVAYMDCLERSFKGAEGDRNNINSGITKKCVGSALQKEAEIEQAKAAIETKMLAALNANEKCKNAESDQKLKECLASEISQGCASGSRLAGTDSVEDILPIASLKFENKTTPACKGSLKEQTFTAPKDGVYTLNANVQAKGQYHYLEPEVEISGGGLNEKLVAHNGQCCKAATFRGDSEVNANKQISLEKGKTYTLKLNYSNRGCYENRKSYIQNFSSNLLFNPGITEIADSKTNLNTKKAIIRGRKLASEIRAQNFLEDNSP